MTELENSQVWSGPPKPLVEFHTGRDKRDSPRALKIYMPVATNAPAAARPPSPVYAKGLALAKSPSRAPSADALGSALGDLDGPPPA